MKFPDRFTLLLLSGFALLQRTAPAIETGLTEYTVVPWRTATWRFYGPNLVTPPAEWRTLTDSELLAHPAFANQTGTISGVDTTADTITVTAHGLSTGAYVTVSPGAGGTIPAPLNSTTAYWVQSISANTLKLFTASTAAQSGTGAVDLTSTGTGNRLLNVKRIIDPVGQSPYHFGVVNGLGDGGDANVSPLPENRIAYFLRTSFDMPPADPNPERVAYLKLRYKRDDALSIWINGTEVKRTNLLPAGALAWNTGTVGNAAVTEPVSNENAEIVFAQIPLTLKGTGNVLAIQVHNAGSASTDIGAGIEVKVAIEPNNFTRLPYVQMVGTNRATIRFNTTTKQKGWAQIYSDEFGGARGEESISTEQHEFTFADLQPGIVYRYSVGQVSGGTDVPLYPLANYNPPTDFAYSFQTSTPADAGLPVRAWILGDPGESNSRLGAVADRFSAYMAQADPEFGPKRLNHILMMGDNAYENGTQLQYQGQLFDNDANNSKVLAWMRTASTFPTIGNHETSNASQESMPNPLEMNAYLNIFSLPKLGECGGQPSGTENYYSFDSGDVHFICLDSQCSDRNSTYTSTDSNMTTWLKNDLQQNTKLWVVAYWHHPPYTKGSHDSDTLGRAMRDMRLNATHVLEDFGVDLVLSGHNHHYERSKLIDGFYYEDNTNALTDISPFLVDGSTGNAGFPAGLSGAYYKGPGEGGTIYSVVGASARGMDTFPSGSPHAIMLGRGSSGNTGAVQTGSYDLPTAVYGSAVLEVVDNQLDFKYIGDQPPTSGPQAFAIKDNFTMYKLVPPKNMTAYVNGSSNDVSWSATRGATGYVLKRSYFPDGPWQTIYDGPNLGSGESGNSGWDVFYYAVAMKSIDGSVGPAAVTALQNGPASGSPPGLSAYISNNAGYPSILLSLSPYDGVVGIGRSIDGGVTFEPCFGGTYESYSFAANTWGGLQDFPPSGQTAIRYKMGTAVYTVDLVPSAPVIDYIYGYTPVDMNITATSGGVESFTIYRSQTPGGPYTQVGTASTSGLSAPFSDHSVTTGQTYYYVAKTNQFGNLSPYSAEVSAAVP